MKDVPFYKFYQHNILSNYVFVFADGDRNGTLYSNTGKGGVGFWSLNAVLVASKRIPEHTAKEILGVKYPELFV